MEVAVNGINVSASLHEVAGAPARAIASHFAPFPFQTILRFQPLSGDPRAEEDGILSPGDRVTLRLDGSDDIDIDVPRLSVSLDVVTGLVSGTAPASGTLDIVIYGRNGSADVTRTAAVDATGAFELVLAGSTQLRRGDHGMLRYRTSTGNTFQLPIETLALDLSLGEGAVFGRSAMGSRVSVGVSDGKGHSIPTPLMASDKSCFVEWKVLRSSSSWCARTSVLSAGDVVTVQKVESGDKLSTTLQVEIPELRVGLIRGTDRLEGVGPPGARLWLTVHGPAGERLNRVAETNGQGRYVVSLGPGVVVAPRWWAEVKYDLADDVVVHARGVIPYFRVDAYRPVVSGVGVPRQVITVTLRSEAGAVKGSASSIVTPSADFSVKLSPVDSESFPDFSLRIMPGDSIEVGFVNGDSTYLLVPLVTAIPDFPTNTVAGVAPPFAELVVVTGHDKTDPSGNPVSAPSVALRADAQGRYSANLPLEGDGDVQLATADGAMFVYNWSGVGISLHAALPYVSGFGPAGHDVTLTLSTPDGNALGSATTFVNWDGHSRAMSWSAAIRNVASELLAPQPGDVVSVVVGEQEQSFVVPRLSARLIPDRDEVIGHTEPRAKVTVSVRQGISSIALQGTGTADGNGDFVISLASKGDIRWNDSGEVSVNIAGAWTHLSISSPGLEMVVNTGILSGHTDPDATVSANLERAGQSLSSVHGRADVLGRFDLEFRDALKAPIPLAGGDTIRVETGATSPTMSLTVPTLQMNVDTMLDTISGSVPVGGYLAISTQLAFFIDQFDNRYASDSPKIEPNGSFVARMLPQVDIGPGSITTMDYQTFEGHIIHLVDHQPILNIPVAGASVCGFGPPGDAVAVALHGQTGAVVGRGSGTIAPAGSFLFNLTTEDSSLRATRPGDVFDVRFGNQSLSLSIPELSATMDWSTGEIRGRGPANARIYLSNPADDCLSDSTATFLQAGPRRNIYTTVTKSNDKGNFITRAPQFLRSAGQGFEISILLADGQRVSRQIVRGRAEIYVHTNRISGRVSPVTAFVLRVVDDVGTLRGTATGTSDATGHFTSVVTDSSSRPVILRPWYHIFLEEAGSTTDVTVLPLSFDLSPSSGLIGNTVPGQKLVLWITLKDGTQLQVVRTAAVDGRFTFGPNDLPVRASWTWADVVRVLAEADTPDGHATMVEWIEAVGNVSPIFLPWSGVSRARR